MEVGSLCPFPSSSIHGFTGVRVSTGRMFRAACMSWHSVPVPVLLELSPVFRSGEARSG